MKSFGLALVGALCAWAAPLYAQVASGVQITSQSYQMSATWTESWEWAQTGAYSSGLPPYPAGTWSAGFPDYPSNPVLTGGYNLSTTDGSPLSASIACATPVASAPLTASASINLFSIQNNAFANVEGQYAPYSAPIGGNAFYEGTIQTSVQANWIFSAADASLDLTFSGQSLVLSGSAGGSVSLTLSDVTASTTLLGVSSGPDGLLGTGGPQDYTFPVNPGDVCELNLSAWTNTQNDDMANQSIEASIMDAPEPQVAWFLLAGSAAVIAFPRNRISRRRV